MSNLRLIINNRYKNKDSKLFFEKDELKIILNLYAKMVSAGSWKDYGLSISSKEVSFSVFKNAAEKPSNKNLRYFIKDSNGKILQNSFDLKILLKNINWKKY